MALLPLLLTWLISGKKEIAMSRQADPENVLPVLMCGEIPWDYSEEALKAQAVLTRSSLYYYSEEGSLYPSSGEGDFQDTVWEEELEIYRRQRSRDSYREALLKMLRQR